MKRDASPAETGAEGRQLGQVFDVIDRQKTGLITTDELLDVVTKLPKGQQFEQFDNRAQFDELVAGDDIDKRKFVVLMAHIRKKCGLSVKVQLQHFQAFFLRGEVFRSVDTNRDGRVTQEELGRFFVGMSQSMDISPALTIHDAARRVKEADLSSGSRGFPPDDFIQVMEDLLADRRDVVLTDFVDYARETEWERQQRKSNIGGLFGRMKDAVAGAVTGVPPPKTPKTPATAIRPPARRGSRSPAGADFAALGDRQATDGTLAADAPLSGQSFAPPSGQSFAPPSGLLSAFSASFRKDRDKSPSPGRLSPSAAMAAGRWAQKARMSPRHGSPGGADDAHGREVELQEMVSALRRQLRQKDDELARSADVVVRLERERRRREKEAPAPRPASDAGSEPSVLQLSFARVNDELQQAQESLRVLQERLQRSEADAAQLRDERRTLEAQLAEEREKARELDGMRLKQSDADTRMRSALREARADAQAKGEELEAALEQLETAQVEATMARYRADTDAPSEAVASPRLWRAPTQGAGSFLDNDVEGDDPEDQVVFLNPPRKVETAEAPVATLFTEPGPIYYEFGSAPPRPAQLLCDMYLTSRATAEYLSCRDGAGLRSVSMYIDEGQLFVPTTRLACPLELHDWFSVTVLFDWDRATYSVHVGSPCVFADVAFRDAGAAAVSAFDVYPRKTAAVSYANIRFVA